MYVGLNNIEGIVNRANGKYTFFSQRASLSDGEAVIYFSWWTLLFIFYLSLRNASKQKAVDSILYSILVLLLIILSMFVDELFYNKLV